MRAGVGVPSALTEDLCIEKQASWQWRTSFIKTLISSMKVHLAYHYFHKTPLPNSISHRWFQHLIGGDILTGEIFVFWGFFSLNLQNPIQSWGIPRPQIPPETEGTQGDSDEGCLHQLSHTSKAVAMVLVRHQSRATFSG